MPMIMGVMAAVFRLYQVIRWGLEVALAVAGESVVDGANGERVAAGAKRAPAPAVAAPVGAIAAGARVGVGAEEEENAVNFYVLYIYICQEL